MNERRSVSVVARRDDARAEVDRQIDAAAHVSRRVQVEVTIIVNG